MPNTKHNRKTHWKCILSYISPLFYHYLPLSRGKRKGNNHFSAGFPIFLDSTCPKTPVYQISYFPPEVQSYVTYLSPYHMQRIIINFFKNCYRHWNSVYPIKSNYRMLFRTIILHNVFLIILTYSPEGGGVRIYDKFEIIRGGMVIV